MENEHEAATGEVDVVDALEAISVIAKWLAGILRKVKEQSKLREENS